MSAGAGAAPGYLDLDGQRLECRTLPARRKGLATIVMLHEGLGCVAAWRDFPERLAQTTGAGVFCYSRAGYGASSPAALPRRSDYMHREACEVLPRVLDAAGIEQPLLLGHSDGASIALIYAGQYPSARATGLILLAPHVFNEPVCVESIRRIRALYESSPDLRARLARYHGEQVDETFFGWNDIWLADEFRHWNIEACLPRIELPVLLLQGEQDEYGSGAHLAAIDARSPGPCTTRWLPQCGHSPQRDQPALTLAAIAGFMGAAVRRRVTFT